MSKEEEVEAKVEKFWKDTMLPNGLNCGEQIAQIVREIHPEAVAVLPLYRSAIAVIPKQGEGGDKYVEIWGYGDPHVEGEDITRVNVEPFHQVTAVSGGRYGPDYYKRFGDNFEKLLTKDIWKNLEKTEEIWRKIEAKKKRK